ncbi:MAG: hypothetical protein ACI8PZ_006655 [Myxococcota bacterium]|jgi:hypothetical protein
MKTHILLAVLLAASITAEEARAEAPAAPTSGPTLTVGEVRFDLQEPGPLAVASPELQASLDIDAVAAEVKRHVAKLRQCYVERLAENPELSGEVLIHWGISDQGRPNHQCLTADTVEDKGVADCVNALVQAGQYPAAKSGETVGVNVPFRFMPG